jgi:hypothetical protein
MDRPAGISAYGGKRHFGPSVNPLGCGNFLFQENVPRASFIESLARLLSQHGYTAFDAGLGKKFAAARYFNDQNQACATAPWP